MLVSKLSCSEEMNAIRTKSRFTVGSSRRHRVFEAFSMLAKRTPGRSGAVQLNAREAAGALRRGKELQPRKAMRPWQATVLSTLFFKKINLQCGEMLEWELVFIFKPIKSTEKCRLQNIM